MRIGVHVGDTVVERNGFRGVRVVGDTVNIASRIESNAPGPGVWVSAQVASDLRNHSHLELQSAGEFSLKNIPEPMEIFQVTIGAGVLPESRPRTHFTYRRQHISRTWVFGLVVLAIALGAGGFAVSQLFDEPETLVILPMEYIGADPGYQHLAPAFWARMQSHLAPVTSVKLSSQSNARRLTETNEYLGDEEVDYFMEGSILLEGIQVTLEVWVVEADDDVILYSQRWQGVLEQLDTIVQEAVVDVGDYVVAEL